MSSPFAHRLQALTDRVDYRQRQAAFEVFDLGMGRARIELGVERADTETGTIGWALASTRTVEDTMTDGQLARTLFGMFLAFEEHECREAFTIDGLRPFGPHITLNALLGAAYHTDPRPT